MGPLGVFGQKYRPISDWDFGPSRKSDKHQILRENLMLEFVT
jgi:hypothetical protein